MTTSLIDELTDLPTPGQGGASGGDLAREIGQRRRTGRGRGSSVTRRAEATSRGQGDAPTLPNGIKLNDE